VSYRLFSAPTRTARRPHVCIWCGELIAPGFKYVDERSLYEGHIQRHRWHPECQAAMHEDFRDGGEEFEAYVNARPQGQANLALTSSNADNAS
jgi:hypothetical protein